MVERLTPAFGRSDSYAYIVLDSLLADEILKTPGTQAGIKRGVLSTRFA